MEGSLNIKKSWIDSTVEEFGRVLPGLIILIGDNEVGDVQLVLERVLDDCWTTAQKPLLEELIKHLV